MPQLCRYHAEYVGHYQSTKKSRYKAKSPHFSFQREEPFTPIDYSTTCHHIITILQNLSFMSLKSSVSKLSHRSAISSGIGYLHAAMAPAIAPMVSESPPIEIAKRMTSSKELPSRKAMIASGTLP